MPVFPFLFLSSFHFKEKSKNSCEPLKNGKQCLRRVPRRIWSDFPCLMHRPHAKHCDRARSENILSDCYQRRGGDTTRRFWRLTGMIRMTFSTRCWSANPDDLPELSYINIVNYFVLGKSAYTDSDTDTHVSS